MDHLADGSMKNVANYVKRCELQNTQNTGTLNAHGRLVLYLTFVCVRVVIRESRLIFEERGGYLLNV